MGSKPDLSPSVSTIAFENMKDNTLAEIKTGFDQLLYLDQENLLIHLFNERPDDMRFTADMEQNRTITQLIYAYAFNLLDRSDEPNPAVRALARLFGDGQSRIRSLTESNEWNEVNFFAHVLKNTLLVASTGIAKNMVRKDNA